MGWSNPNGGWSNAERGWYGKAASGSGFSPTQFNSSDKSSNLNLTLVAGSLVQVNATANVNGIVRTVASHSSGKYYAEVNLDVWSADAVGLGIANSSETLTNFIGQTSNSFATYNNGWYTNNTLQGTSGVAYVQSHALAYAIDCDNKMIWVKDITASGNWNNSGTADPATNTGGASFSALAGPWFFTAGIGNSTEQVTANFGGGSFAGAVPSGFTSGF